MIEKYSEGCYRLRGRGITAEDVDKLRAEASQTALHRARICIHRDANDTMQEMFVLMMKDSPKGTYKYGKAASFLMLEGQMEIEFYSEGGKLMDHATLLPNGFIKIEAGTYIKPIIQSDHVLLYEVHEGPWVGPSERTQMRGIAYEREHALAG